MLLEKNFYSLTYLQFIYKYKTTFFSIVVIIKYEFCPINNRTVWYELLCGEYPFKGQPPEAIIWQVGKGVKQSLANMQASRDIKVNKNILVCF